MRTFSTDILRLTVIRNRMIVIGGIGKMFYQDGFPISLSITECNKQGIEVSYLHIADELLKNGWKSETVLKRLGEDHQDDVEKNNKYPEKELREFVYKEYEDQREMIFNYLFVDREQATRELRELCQN